MDLIESRELHRIVSAFALSGERFLISNKSLLVLADHVAGRLNAKRDELDK